MADFRFKLLGLAAFATMFAGVSFGQNTITACAANSSTTPAPGIIAAGGAAGPASPGPASARAEGTTELMGDFQFNCSTATAIGAPLGGVTLSVFMSAPVTSKVLTTNAATGPFYTEAALFLCSSAALCTTPGAPTVGPGVTVTYGTVSGNQIVFNNNVTIPGTTLISSNPFFYGRIANVRVNASAVALAATLTPVTAQILASLNASSAATGTTGNVVGYVFKSLATPTFVTNANGGTTATLTAYTTCAGNALPAAGGNALVNSFVLNVAENVAGVKAFKLQNSTAGSAGENGSYFPNDGSGSGTASFGTRLNLTFGAVANGITLYLPTTVTNGGLTLRLTTTTAGDVVASTAVGAPANTAAYTPSNGTVTAVYEVTATNKNAQESATIPVVVVFAKNAFTTTQGPITVIEGLGPQAAAASATTVPNFAPVTAPVLNATTISLCSTNLLFPFVTSALGFDTGIALSNTSADPFGTTASPGSCTLNFYGTGAPSPSTGVPAPGGVQNAGTANGFLLSNVAPGFTGYMIAACNYNFGHGFAYITYNLTQNNGTSMGYVAQVMPNRGTGVISETLGQ